MRQVVTRTPQPAPAAAGASRAASPDSAEAKAPPSGGPRAGHDFSRIAIHAPRAAGRVESLAVSDPNDADEREAEDLAARVADGRAVTLAGPRPPVDSIAARLSEGQPGGGQPLDGATRTEMQSRLGVDLGDVRLHTGRPAQVLTGALQARAFTLGRDVYFGDGQLDPRSREGRRLLAHELVHTRQPGRGPVPRLRRQLAGAGPSSAGAGTASGPIVMSGVVWEQSLPDDMFDPLLGGLGKSIRNSGWVKLSAKHQVALKLTTSQETGKLKAEAGKVDIKARLDKHLYEATVKAFEIAYTKEPDKKELDEKDLNDRVPGGGFQVESKLAWLTATIKGSKPPEFAVASLTIAGKYVISAKTLDVVGWEAVLPEAGLLSLQSIRKGKFWIEGKVEMKLSVEPKALHDYLKTRQAKVEAEKTGKKHADLEEQYRTDADEARRKKNAARKEKERIQRELHKKRQKLKRLQSGEAATGAEANTSAAELEAEIAEEKRRLEDAKEALKTEQQRLQRAREAANAERKAVKTAGREVKALEKQIKHLERLAESKFEKLRRRIAERTAKLEKLSRYLADRAARWIEERAARYIGTKLALQAARLAARVILRAIPIIGEILLIWDALTLLWDLGVGLWNWITGKDDTGEGEGQEGAGQEGETGTGTGSEPAAGGAAGGAGSRPEGAQKTGTAPVGEGAGDAETGKTTSAGGVDTTATPADTAGTATPGGGAGPPVPQTPAEGALQKESKEPGTVAPYETPGPNPSDLELVRHDAIDRSPRTLKAGEECTFTLVVHFIGAGGSKKSAEAPQQRFKCTWATHGEAQVHSVDGFVIKTEARRIYYGPKYKFKVKLPAGGQR